MATLAIYQFGYRLNAVRYPWKASLGSALALANHVYFCECYGDDGVWKDLLELKDFYGDRLHLLRHPWGGHYTIQATLGNLLLDEIGTSTDYALKLDADEVLCEWSFPLFREQLEQMHVRNVILARPHYTHFCPDEQHEFDFIYRSKAVISRTKDNLRFSLGKGGDACALGGAPEVQTNLEVFHYGKYQVGRKKEALTKEYEFQQLYTELGFPDPLVVKQWQTTGVIDYEEIFHVAREKGAFRTYDGKHPVFIQEWLAESRRIEGANLGA